MEVHNCKGPAGVPQESTQFPTKCKQRHLQSMNIINYVEVIGPFGCWTMYWCGLYSSQHVLFYLMSIYTALLSC